MLGRNHRTIEEITIRIAKDPRDNTLYVEAKRTGASALAPLPRV